MFTEISFFVFVNGCTCVHPLLDGFSWAVRTLLAGPTQKILPLYQPLIRTNFAQLHGANGLVAERYFLVSFTKGEGLILSSSLSRQVRVWFLQGTWVLGVVVDTICRLAVPFLHSLRSRLDIYRVWKKKKNYCTNLHGWLISPNHPSFRFGFWVR